MAKFTISDPHDLAHGQDPIFLAHERSHPIYNDFGPSFFSIAQSHKWQDLSFLVSLNDVAIALVHCATDQKNLSFYGFPIRIIWFCDQDDLRKNAAKEILKTLKDHAATHQLNELLLQSDDCAPILGPLSEVLTNEEGVQKHNHYHAIADISPDEATLKKDLRKSYKSLVNWGKKNIDLQVIDQANPAKDKFETFVRFYEKTAGGKPHSPAFWEALFVEIKKGNCSLHMGFAKDTDQLISTTVIVNDQNVSYYFLGAYDRDLFDKPIAHWPIFAALLYEKDKGRQFFDFGEFYLKDHPNQKEQSIGFFKKGFTKRYETFSHWQLTLPPLIT